MLLHCLNTHLASMFSWFVYKFVNPTNIVPRVLDNMPRRGNKRLSYFCVILLPLMLSLFVNIGIHTVLHLSALSRRIIPCPGCFYSYICETKRIVITMYSLLLIINYVQGGPKKR